MIRLLLPLLLQAQRWGNLPNSLVKQEKDFIKKMAQLEAALLEKRPAAELDSLRALFNALHLDIQQFKTKIEQDYPHYAALKYEQPKLSAADLQALLDDKTALLEYMIGKDKVYLFYVDKRRVQAVSVSIATDSLKNLMDEFRKSLSHYAFIRKQPQEAYAQYTQRAYALYQLLLQPILPTSQPPTHLVIIPDRELGHLPFETFLTKEAPANGLNYKDLSYLMRDLKISYNYSATWWKYNLQSKRRPHNGQLLAIAANYETPISETVLESRLPEYRRLREALSPLPSARDEVQRLSKHFQGLFWLDDQANERLFKQKAPEYGILHLAMHGLLNQKNSVLSALAFTEDGDSLENNFLQAYEISKMQLSADLVVLSACETGYGKFEKGNGTASLARAFMYAGVPALVVSLWEVNDASTAQIMQHFYQQLANGEDKATALQQAKLQYLSQAEGIAGHPAYWSAFVQMGDNQPVLLHERSSWLAWLFGLAGAGLLVGMVGWRRRERAA